MRTFDSWPIAALVGLCLACAGSDATPDPAATGETGSDPGVDSRARLTVAVVNYPLAWMAGEIGAVRVNVVFPVPAGDDPAYWSPGPDEIAAYQRADLILLNGAGYASWTDRASLPPSKLVDTSAGFAELLVPAGDRVVHTHGPGGEHEHGETAFTTWLDPLLAARQAEAIRDAMVQADSAGAGAYEDGLVRVRDALAGVDEGLEAAFAAFDGAPLLASHPVYQYLARRYGLDLRSVHFEPDEAPSAAGWAELRALVEDRPSRWMLWEAEPLPAVRERLERELGIRSIVFETCGNRPVSGDFLRAMQENVARVTAAAENP